MASPPFKVKAVYEYTSEHDDDLKFPIGQIINVTEQEGDDWYVGEYTDSNGAKQEGLFPTNFVEKYEPEVPTRPTRPARPKSEVQSPPPPPAPVVAQDDPEEEEAPPVPAMSKPQAPPGLSASAKQQEHVTSPTSTTTPRSPPTRSEPPAAPKPTPAEPAQPATAPAKAGPPPVAPKSNAFKDRIAAFNKVEQPPLPKPGQKPQRNDYIKKPFVAPPPSSSAYVPPPTKQEPVHKPYMREEDPEIRQKQEEDRQAAEAAGLTGESQPPAAGGEEDEDAPKPMSLKERMAMLQKEQEAQRARHAEVAQRKQPKPLAKKPSEPLPEDEDEEPERPVRQSLDAPREKPRAPSAQRRPTEPMSPVPAPPEHEILSGGEEADQSAAGETTEDDTGTIGPEDSDEKLTPAPTRAPTAPAREPDVGDEDDTTEDAGGEEEELDEEEQRKQRLRERMARLAGGQQGGGPFNPFGMPPAASAPAKKRSTGQSKRSTEDSASPSGAPQIPQMIAIPGMGGSQRMQSPQSDATERVQHAEPEEMEEDEEPVPPPRRSTTEERGAPPPLPKADRAVPAPPTQHDRAAPPPVPSESTRPTPRPPQAESRPVPPPPPTAGGAPPPVPMSPGPGYVSDDEMSMNKRSSAETSGVETPLPLPIRTGTGGAPPVPSRDTPKSPEYKRASYFGSEPSSATSDRRASRMPPPIPGSEPRSPVTSPRPPPPPPPTAAPPSRQNTDLHPAANEETERGESDYEGDYDTDIASSAKHKDALKSHAREPSLDDSTTADEDTLVTTPAAAPRAVPPLPPQASRPSMDAPRTPPPVPPPTREQTADDDYDPYRYDGNRDPNSRAPPPVPGAIPISAPPIPPDEPPAIHEDSSADDVPPSGPPPTRKSMERAPPPPPTGAERSAPPMPPASAQAPPQQMQTPPRAAPRQSLDVQRQPSMARRSMEQGRPSMDTQGQIAQDLDLAPNTQWWTTAQPLPPVLQSRNGIDILSESEESKKSKRGGRTMISKDIYVLFMDYSQTVITAQYDSREPADVTLEQRHEPPPPKLRQDQLETYWQRFGSKIAQAANQAGNSKKDSTIGDGTPASIPLELIKSHPDALLPIGNRAYGALVYANLANASTMQFDEIRPGDIITVRNAKFEGHHGTMRQKYKADYGPQHVAVVEEWDGTRRSVRAWEQGRERKAGVRGEKFRLGDLRSGEVRVWRVVGREWVGWESS